MTTRLRTIIFAVTTILACDSDRRPPDPQSIPPTLDLVPIAAGPAKVHVVGCPPDGPLAKDRVERQVHVAAFAIAREPVTCDELARCHRLGVCGSIALTCKGGVAFESHHDAEKYCRWVGARLPSYAEWQRAIYGVEGAPSLGGASQIEGACEKTTIVVGQERCQRRSGAGLTYYTGSFGRWEWTSDVGCDLMARPGPGDTWEKYVARGPIALELGKDALSAVTVLQEYGEFRCAVDR